ncbi:MAG: Trehalose import ATP-binding protein SugC [Tenericutes bacterium ADurb.Bin087]|nr:MAG: Trehalose import ATP-binding protein SugC [Tenericutes bacterium ADurb.Bin087]
MDNVVPKKTKHVNNAKENDVFVRLIDVNKVYDKNVHAVVDFNMEIKKKEFVVFVGPSGCGKSTTLRMIAGLEDITSGELYIDGVLANNLPSKDRDIAMVFQNYALYPNMTVYDNMAFSLKVRRFPKGEIKERVIEAAQVLELDDYLHRRPKALSGGQRQRVALGRAFVRNAQLFLMDEPLSNLDAKLRVQTRSEIIRLHKELNTTTIYVTHDQTEAMTMADRIVVMKGGYVQQIGTPLEIYRYPANRFVASFIGSPAMNFAKATLNGDILTFENNQTIKLLPKYIKMHKKFYENELVLLKEEMERYDLPEDKETADYHNLLEREQQIKAILKGDAHEVIFGIRPEAIKMVDSKVNDSIEVEVKLSELLGDQYYIHFDFAGRNMLAKVESEDEINTGDKINLLLQLTKVHLFDALTHKTIYVKDV